MAWAGTWVYLEALSTPEQLAIFNYTEAIKVCVCVCVCIDKYDGQKSE